MTGEGKEGGNALPKIRTMETDAQIFVREKKISPVEIAAKTYISQEPRKISRPFPYKIFFYSVIFLAIAGLGGYFGWKFFSMEQIEPMLNAPKPPPALLIVDGENIIRFREATPGELINGIKSELGKNRAFGSIFNFPVEFENRTGQTQFADSKNLAVFLNWKSPEAFLDNLSPEFNLLVTYSESNNIAVAIKIKNFERALASLLEWERTMWLDWKPFLNESDVANIAQFTFQDEIIQNNDARVLKNAENKSVLGYSIFNKNLIIFGNSRDSIAIVLDRLIKLSPR